MRSSAWMVSAAIAEQYEMVAGFDQDALNERVSLDPPSKRRNAQKAAYCISHVCCVGDGRHMSDPGQLLSLGRPG